MSRSDDQGATAAKTVAAMRARGYRPSFRWHQRRDPPRRSFCCEGIAGQCFKGAGALFLAGIGKMRCRPQRVTERGSGRSAHGCIAHLLADLTGLGVAVPDLLVDL